MSFKVGDAEQFERSRVMVQGLDQAWGELAV